MASCLNYSSNDNSSETDAQGPFSTEVVCEPATEGESDNAAKVLSSIDES